MSEAFICDYIRTPIGDCGGVLREVCTDDLGAHPTRVLMEPLANLLSRAHAANIHERARLLLDKMQ